MPEHDVNLSRPADSPGQFESTHWSVVLAAAQTASPKAQEALERLCEAYWYPLYAFLRRQGLDEHEAKDMTQEFFAERIVTKKIFQGMQEGRGRFRSWLLASLRNFLANEYDRQNAVKRGGGAAHVPLQMETAERWYRLEPVDDATPEVLYEKAWATTLLTHACDRLRQRYTEKGKDDWFQWMRCFLPGEQSGRSRTEVAAQLGLSESAINTAISRLRQEFGEFLRAEVKRTVSNTGEVDDEIRRLIQVVGG